MKFCVDCRHFDGEYSCLRELGEINIVRGGRFVNEKNVWTERYRFNWFLLDRCGYHGKYWEAK